MFKDVHMMHVLNPQNNAINQNSQSDKTETAVTTPKGLITLLMHTHFCRQWYPAHIEMAWISWWIPFQYRCFYYEGQWPIVLWWTMSRFRAEKADCTLACAHTVCIVRVLACVFVCHWECVSLILLTWMNEDWQVISAHVVLVLRYFMNTAWGLVCTVMDLCKHSSFKTEVFLFSPVYLPCVCVCVCVKIHHRIRCVASFSKQKLIRQIRISLNERHEFLPSVSGNKLLHAMLSLLMSRFLNTSCCVSSFLRTC